MNRHKANVDDSPTLKVGFTLKSLARLGCDKSQIWLTTTIKGERARVFTKLLIDPALWLPKADTRQYAMASEDVAIGRVKLQECKKINIRLKEIIGYCKDYMQLADSVTLDEKPMEHNATNFKRYLDERISGQRAKVEGNITVEQYVTEYINKKKSMVNKNTRRTVVKGTVYNHTNALRRLKLFCKEKHIRLSWAVFDRKFETSFTAWLCEQGYTANTIACQYSIMKVWLNEAEIDGLVTDKAFHKYPTKVYNVENIYLTEEEIQRLYDIDFNSKEVQEELGYAIGQGGHYEETRDLFVVACWTALRFGDWKDIMSVADIGEDYMTVHTHKTNQEVIIPLHPLVKAIIKKYNGNLPKAVYKGRTIAQIRECARIAKIDTPTSLCKVKGGKSVISKGKKYEFIMNHTSRRSFATNMYLKGVPTISIMSITGHTSEENFMKYIKVDKSEHAKIVAQGFMQKTLSPILN